MSLIYQAFAINGNRDPNAAANDRVSIKIVRCLTNGLVDPFSEPIAITRPEKPAKTIENSVIVATDEASIISLRYVSRV